jgi:hypothetical protein
MFSYIFRQTPQNRGLLILTLNFSGNQTVIDDPVVRHGKVWDRTRKATHQASADRRSNAKDFQGAVK